MLSEKEEMILMRLHDGEISPLGRIWLRLTVLRKPASQLYLKELKQISSVTKYSVAGSLWDDVVGDSESTLTARDNTQRDNKLWDNINSRISELEAGQRASNKSLTYPNIITNNSNIEDAVNHSGAIKWYNSQWFERLGCGATGAFITASLMILSPQVGLNSFQSAPSLANNSSPSSKEPSKLVVKNDRIDSLSVVENASFSSGGSSGRYASVPSRISGGQTDADWFKSFGRMRLAQDTQTGSTLVWVNRRRLGNYKFKASGNSPTNSSIEFRDPAILPNSSYSTHE
jgi:hypothetical protein